MTNKEKAVELVKKHAPDDIELQEFVEKYEDAADKFRDEISDRDLSLTLGGEWMGMVNAFLALKPEAGILYEFDCPRCKEKATGIKSPQNGRVQINCKCTPWVHFVG